MKKLLFATTIMAVAAVSASANDNTNVSKSRTPAIATSSTQNPAAPVEGRNSFTESQVKQRLADAGYTNATGLTKGSNGIWNGMAEKDGVAYTIAFDYQGNITNKPVTR